LALQGSLKGISAANPLCFTPNPLNGALNLIKTGFALALQGSLKGISAANPLCFTPNPLKGALNLIKTGFALALQGSPKGISAANPPLSASLLYIDLHTFSS
jgi:hypothetical protein